MLWSLILLLLLLWLLFLIIAIITIAIFHLCYHRNSIYCYSYHTYLLNGWLRKKCLYLELFWSAFSRIRAEYGEIRFISPYLVRMRKNVDQNGSEYKHFSRSGWQVFAIRERAIQQSRQECCYYYFSM